MFLLFLTSKGSGFKLGPVTGEFLATLVVGKCPKYAVEPFAASRFPETSLQSFLWDAENDNARHQAFLPCLILHQLNKLIHSAQNHFVFFGDQK